MVTSPPRLSILRRHHLAQQPSRSQFKYCSDDLLFREGGGQVVVRDGCARFGVWGDNGEVFLGDYTSVNLAVQHFFWKCSAQRSNLSPSLCRTLPSLATRLDEGGFETFSQKDREPPLPCCSATRARRSASAARSLHQALRALSATTLHGELPKVLSLKMSDVLWWCILQVNVSFFVLPGQVAGFIGDPIRVTTSTSWCRRKGLTSLLDG